MAAFTFQNPFWRQASTCLDPPTGRDLTNCMKHHAPCCDRESLDAFSSLQWNVHERDEVGFWPVLLHWSGSQQDQRNQQDHSIIISLLPNIRNGSLTVIGISRKAVASP